MIEYLVEDAIVSELCALEFAASVSRGVRSTGLLSEQAAQEALADFDEWRALSTVATALSIADFNLAASFVRDFATKLAAADALHLAAAINAGAKLATFDKRLAEAAKTRGEGVVSWTKPETGATGLANRPRPAPRKTRLPNLHPTATSLRLAIGPLEQIKLAAHGARRALPVADQDMACREGGVKARMLP